MCYFRKTRVWALRPDRLHKKAAKAKWLAAVETGCDFRARANVEYRPLDSLQIAAKTQDLALFYLGIDSKLRGCDLVSLQLLDIAQGKTVLPRAMVMQRKTHRPVQFEITEQTRQSVAAWIEKAHLAIDQYLFPSSVAKSPHLSTRQYARIVACWVE